MGARICECLLNSLSARSWSHIAMVKSGHVWPPKHQAFFLFSTHFRSRISFPLPHISTNLSTYNPSIYLVKTLSNLFTSNCGQPHFSLSTPKPSCLIFPFIELSAFWTIRIKVDNVSGKCSKAHLVRQGSGTWVVVDEGVWVFYGLGISSHLLYI